MKFVVFIASLAFVSLSAFADMTNLGVQTAYQELSATSFHYYNYLTFKDGKPVGFGPSSYELATHWFKLSTDDAFKHHAILSIQATFPGQVMFFDTGLVGNISAGGAQYSNKCDYVTVHELGNDKSTDYFLISELKYDSQNSPASIDFYFEKIATSSVERAIIEKICKRSTDGTVRPVTVNHLLPSAKAFVSIPVTNPSAPAELIK